MSPLRYGTGRDGSTCLTFLVLRKGKPLNPMNIIIPIDLLEEIFLGLPLKSILIFKTVSKHWRSILESRSFAERRMKAEKKNPKILAVGDHRFKLDAGEIEVVCLLAAKRPSLTCEGLVCLPVPGCVNVLNPSTGEYISFPSGIDLVTKRFDGIFFVAPWWNIFPGYWAMGFGKDQVNGNYKVVRMFFEPKLYCEILDVSIGEWRIVNPPPYPVDPRRKSVCVNGSIYWPVAVCKEGIFFFCDNKKRLFKYYPKTNKLSCISSDIWVISDFDENLVSLCPSSLARTSEYLSGFHYQYDVQDDVQDNVKGS
ncbi:hypothetical protein F2Q68_00027153 [Brassica cretica]|uniref:F-box domain-containing protein n=1 Tax=Brassica cretica TaxID=69181 RepID=A0A8S9IC42_BRACR|nr:hypothetical protein F2Q68_00027153 [Brassica cretica]